MTRKTPAGFRAATWPLLLGVIALTFLLKACAEQPPTETTAVSTTPQLAAGGPAASCTPQAIRPCVEVVVRGKPGNQEVNDVVVTLVQGGIRNSNPATGPFDQSGPYDPGDGNLLPGRPLKKKTVNGVATFDAAEFDLIGDYSELGYCAHMTPVDENTAKAIVDGVETYVVPNGVAPPLNPAAWQGVLSGNGGKTEPLNKPNYLAHCVSWSLPSQAPFSLTPGAAVRVDLTTSASFASFDVTCRFFDGTSVGRLCPTWTLIDLSDVELDWCNRFASTGVKCGVLASAASENAAKNWGLAFDQLYAIESAAQENTAPGELPDEQQYTFSGFEQSPKGKKKGQAAAKPVTADLDPTLCRAVTEPPESVGEVTRGPDLLRPVTDGYLATTALNGAFFEANQRRVSIFYEYIDRCPADDDACSRQLTLHMRAKLKGPDGSPTTANKVLIYDYAECPNATLQGSASGSDLVEVKTECRTVLETNRIYVVHSVKIPAERELEWRIDTAEGETHPEPARSEDPIVRSMRLIEAIDATLPAQEQCPLPGSTIGDDSKWDIIN